MSVKGQTTGKPPAKGAAAAAAPSSSTPNASSLSQPVNDLASSELLGIETPQTATPENGSEADEQPMPTPKQAPRSALKSTDITSRLLGAMSPNKSVVWGDLPRGEGAHSKWSEGGRRWIKAKYVQKSRKKNATVGKSAGATPRYAMSEIERAEEKLQKLSARDSARAEKGAADKVAAGTPDASGSARGRGRGRGGMPPRAPGGRGSGGSGGSASGSQSERLAAAGASPAATAAAAAAHAATERGSSSKGVSSGKAPSASGRQTGKRSRLGAGSSSSDRGDQGDAEKVSGEAVEDGKSAASAAGAEAAGAEDAGAEAAGAEAIEGASASQLRGLHVLSLLFGDEGRRRAGAEAGAEVGAEVGIKAGAAVQAGAEAGASSSSQTVEEAAAQAALVDVSDGDGGSTAAAEAEAEAEAASIEEQIEEAWLRANAPSPDSQMADLEVSEAMAQAEECGAVDDSPTAAEPSAALSVALPPSAAAAAEVPSAASSPSTTSSSAAAEKPPKPGKARKAPSARAASPSVRSSSPSVRASGGTLSNRAASPASGRARTGGGAGGGNKAGSTPVRRASSLAAVKARGGAR